MGFPLSFFFIKSNNIFFFQILLQDKYIIYVARLETDGKTR